MAPGLSLIPLPMWLLTQTFYHERGRGAMTKQELSHHLELRKRLTSQRGLLASLEDAGLSDEAAGIRDDIARLDAEVQQSEAAVVAWIGTIKDVPTRTIFRLRFIRCMTWLQVAKTIGGGNTTASVKMIFHRYLKANYDE